MSEACARESNFVRVNPLREILLAMIGVFFDITSRAVVSYPRNIRGVGDRGLRDWSGYVVGRGAIVSDSVVVSRLGLMIFATSKFIPFIIRQAIAIAVEGNHHDARFGTTT
jgi:hypothetical protein